MIDLSKRFRDIVFEKKKVGIKKKIKKKKKRDLTETIFFQFETDDLNNGENIFWKNIKIHLRFFAYHKK